MKTPGKIRSVRQLVEALRKNPSGQSYLHILKSIDIPLGEYEKFYTWNPLRYTRNCLVRTADVELLLVCWEKEQQSPIQDYDTQEAWIHPVQGRLKEERFRFSERKLEKVSSVLLGPAEFSYMAAPIALHRYINHFETRSVSLHLYAKPIEKRKEYKEETGEAVETAVSYDVVYQFDEKGNVHSF